MKKLIIRTLAASSMLAATNAFAFNLITNGDFEANGGSLDGWTHNSNVQVAHVNDTPNLYLGGMDNNYALLGYGTTNSNSTLRQTFEITGLNEITVSFDWAFNYFDNSPSAEDTFLSLLRQDSSPAERITLQRLRTNGTSFLDVDLGREYGFYSETIDISHYTADDARVVFRLREEEDSRFWTGTGSYAGIDNVHISGVSPVPEPSTYAMFGTAFLMLGFMGYRSRNRKS